MSQIRSIIHIYGRDTLVYIVPLVQLAEGPWQETLPVYQAGKDNVRELALALEKIQKEAGKVVDSAPNAWHSEFGEALREASTLCVLRWYESGQIRVIPQRLHIYSNERDEAIERGWLDVQAEAVELPAGSQFNTIVRKVVERL